MLRNINITWIRKVRYYLAVFGCLIFLTIPSFLQMLIKGLKERTDIY